MGRFLNADALASTGQGVLGYNMFAYCANSVVTYSDSEGTRHEHFAVSIRDVGLVASKTIQESIDNLTELKVLSSLEKNGAAFYKGVPVIHGIVQEDSGFSAGLIFLGSSVKANEFGVSTLRHEYGHVLHLSQIGWESYFVWVLVPSVTNYFRGVPYQDYYSQPWEYIADVLGGVKRTYNGLPYNYSPDAEARAQAYWQLTYDYVGVYP